MDKNYIAGQTKEQRKARKNANKAKKAGVSTSKVRAIYNRGLAAYRTSGHRKGVSPQAWAMARVNSANPSKSWAVVKKSKAKKKKK